MTTKDPNRLDRIETLVRSNARFILNDGSAIMPQNPGS